MSDLQKHLISKRESDVLASEYENSNYVAINAKRSGQTPDSKHFTYDLEVLQDYINLIREGMEKKGIKHKGIRVTLGKYPEQNYDSRLDPAFKGYQTIFFSPQDLDSSHDEVSISARAEDGDELPNLNFGQISPPYH